MIMQGLEILCLKACSVEVKCSYNFLQMPLSALPKAFGLKELKKGYFPHLFNTPENENYTGPLPDKKYYQPDYMKPKAREEFLKWYDQQTEADYIFNFQTEFQAYCNSDMTILREALMKFRDDFIEQTAVDPLLYPVTLPSACSRVYRQNDMPEDTIAIIPEGGYQKGEKQSIVALKWLWWMAEKEDYQIQDNLHGGEKRIDGTPYRQLSALEGIDEVQGAATKKTAASSTSYKTAGKLLFPLCKSCCKGKNQEICNNSEEEKAFWGTWCTNEIYKALKLGYEVLKIVEVWHFEEWSTYNGKDDSTGLFTKYVNRFLKIKVEASGWPGWVKTDEDREKYIENYKKREGIPLDKEKIETNPVLRSLAKICHNSFWGKFGQRQNLTKTEYFTDPQAYFNLIGN
uniref:DNA-directed DNA polymerase n=1 Tax=Plectus sambesii TaxID=2011161 RepID=A0A914VZL6_9BILA